MLQVGDAVQWSYNVDDKLVERYGTVFEIIPPNRNPQEYVHNNHTLFTKVPFRSEISYLVKVPGSNKLYWPHTSILAPLYDKTKLYTQEAPSKLKVIAGKINRYDREAIKAICKITKLIFGDEYFEGKNFLTFPQWGYRFWFDVKGGVEFIKEVEKFKPVKVV
jgi:hypothetical protein